MNIDMGHKGNVIFMAHHNHYGHYHRYVHGYGSYVWGFLGLLTRSLG